MIALSVSIKPCLLTICVFVKFVNPRTLTYSRARHRRGLSLAMRDNAIKSEPYSKRCSVQQIKHVTWRGEGAPIVAMHGNGNGIDSRLAWSYSVLIASSWGNMEVIAKTEGVYAFLTYPYVTVSKKYCKKQIDARQRANK